MGDQMTFADFRDVISMCDQDFTIMRTKPGVWVNGRYHQDSEPELITGSGSVQPAAGEDLAMLPEGARSEEVVAIFTPCSLKIGKAEADGKEEPDKICIGGKVYEPQFESDWSTLGRFFKYVCVRVGQ